MRSSYLHFSKNIVVRTVYAWKFLCASFLSVAQQISLYSLGADTAFWFWPTNKAAQRATRGQYHA